MVCGRYNTLHSPSRPVIKCMSYHSAMGLLCSLLQQVRLCRGAANAGSYLVLIVSLGTQAVHTPEWRSGGKRALALRVPFEATASVKGSAAADSPRAGNRGKAQMPHHFVLITKPCGQMDPNTTCASRHYGDAASPPCVIAAANDSIL
jgi:hypothetical protein|mmetsp:Transcript_84630/g.141098  ORF Transcript_84630/g.141098 Transcript_84630/m.141098 type:complete len:148 (-) Transcript_84630:575-1018(-)